MKVKQNKIIKAYQTTDKYATHENIPLDLKWKQYSLRQILRPFYEFQIEQENMMRRKYAQFADKNGEIVGKQYSDFLSEMEDLANLDMDVDMHGNIQIILADYQMFTIQDIESLDNFVDFVFKTDGQDKEK